MVVTAPGITMAVNPVQPENAEAPMDVREPGSVTAVSPLQP